jgi:uncharacterized PurR-regulated membrane protein YhhQ (DUF165 family)
MAAFVTVLLCANLIGASKVASIGAFAFGAGVLFFPISYVFGDNLTEVYGYARARKVVLSGFGALVFAPFMSWAVLSFPPRQDGRTRPPSRPSSEGRRASWPLRWSPTSPANSAIRSCWPR